MISGLTLGHQQRYPDTKGKEVRVTQAVVSGSELGRVDIYYYQVEYLRLSLAALLFFEG